MSNEQPHDPTITLRLELGRVTDQRDAYQSALRKEVLAVIRNASVVEAIDGADIQTWKLRSDNWQKLLQLANEENARLKAEVERLKEDNRQLTNAFEIAEGIIKRMGKAAEAAAKEGKPKNSKDALEFIHTLDSLAIKKQKEEIERLCAWGRGLESDLSHARVEISFLKAEVERLEHAIVAGQAIIKDAQEVKP